MRRSVTNKLTRVFMALLLPSAAFAASPAAPPPIRAVTFNIYNHPWERAARLANTVEFLRKANPDIICLQEVARGLFLPGDPSTELSEALKMPVLRFWHEQNFGLFRTGIAVLSRFPILSSEYHDFAQHGFWNYKGYMLVKLALPGGKTLQLVNLHMASTTDAQLRRDEWHELAGFVRGLQAQGPVLIVGDFNTDPTDPALQEFVKTTGVKSLYDGWKNLSQMRSWTPDYRDSCASNKAPEAQLIDFFFALPASSPGGGSLQFQNGRIVQPGRLPHPSDHCPVEAEISFTP